MKKSASIFTPALTKALKTRPTVIQCQTDGGQSSPLESAGENTARQLQERPGCRTDQGWDHMPIIPASVKLM